MSVNYMRSTPRSHSRRGSSVLFTPRASNQSNHYYNHPRTALSRTTFDILRAEKFLHRTNPDFDHSKLAKAINDRLVTITMRYDSPAYYAISSLMCAVQNALDGLSIERSGAIGSALDGCVLIKEYHKVGSFKTDTMIAGQNTADIVLTLQSLPLHSTLEKLSSQIVERIKSNEKSKTLKEVESEQTDFGFELKTPKARVRFMVCTVFENLSKLDSLSHVPKRLCSIAFNAIKHTKWVESNCDQMMRILVKLIKDIRNRFSPMKSMSSRMIELLASYSIANINNKPNSLNTPLPVALLRAFQLLSSGIFLPGSSGIPDPILSNNAHFNELNLTEMDDVCRGGQMVLRLLHNEAYKQVFSGTPNPETPIVDDTLSSLSKFESIDMNSDGEHSTHVESPSSRTDAQGGCLFNDCPLVRWYPSACTTAQKLSPDAGTSGNNLKRPFSADDDSLCWNSESTVQNIQTDNTVNAVDSEDSGKTSSVQEQTVDELSDPLSKQVKY